MNQRLRDGTLIVMDNGQDKFLQKLYGSKFGRFLLKPLVSPVVSKLGGWFMSTRLSKCMIKGFIRKNNIDMSQFEEGPFRSYNAFFTRRIKPGARTVDMDPTHLISPCDCKLTALPIEEDSRFTIKHTPYTTAELLKDEALAKAYQGGQILIFRLTVDDYHRYCYFADGEKSGNTFIPGKLHTVNPIANDYYPIYKENSREYTTLHTQAFGDVIVMEVGALMVGKIVNHHGACTVRRGEEKGYFQFGGSTVILLLKAGAAQLDQDILDNSREGMETVVRMGEKIGQAC